MTSRELDALVAEKVVGWNSLPIGVSNDGVIVFTEPEHYSTEISAAWEVVERLHELNWNVEILYEEAWKDKTTDSNINCYVRGKSEMGIYTYIRSTWDKTAPRAICIAALKAVGIEIKEG